MMSKILYTTPNFFKGKWNITRDINNKINTDLSAQCEGIATFEFDKENNNILNYNESLKVKWFNGDLIEDASKKYQYKFDENTVTKYNEIKSRFNSYYAKMFDLTYSSENAQNYSAMGSYKCGDDQYNCKINFQSNDFFSITYSVEGPDKNYIAITEFERDVEAIGNCSLHK